MNSEKNNEFYEIAIKLCKNEKFEEAIKYINKAIIQDPNNYKIYLNKALALVYIRNFDEAIKSFEEAEKINPNDKSIWYNKGLTYI